MEGEKKKEMAPAVRPPALDLALSMPLVERALQVLERRNVQPQLGLLKSTMLQLDSTFNESAYGARSFSDFVERLKKADLVFVRGTGGRYFIERKFTARHDKPMPRPDEALPMLRDTLETHRLEFEEGGRPAGELFTWMQEEYPKFDHKNYGFQEFTEFLNFAQDKTVVRTEPREDGVMVFLGAEFYPPALPSKEVREEDLLTEHDFKQPIVKGQPTATGEIPVIEDEPKKKRVTRKKTAAEGDKPRRTITRRKKTS
jgi:hypothetical protein